MKLTLRSNEVMLRTNEDAFGKRSCASHKMRKASPCSAYALKRSCRWHLAEVTEDCMRAGKPRPYG